jgi:hypothetical protein
MRGISKIWLTNYLMIWRKMLGMNPCHENLMTGAPIRY